MDVVFVHVESLVALLVQTEIILTKAIQGGKAISDSSTFLPKMPPNPTRIDHLIVNQMKEQGKVRYGPTPPSPDQFSTQQSGYAGYVYV